MKVVASLATALASLCLGYALGSFYAGAEPSEALTTGPIAPSFLPEEDDEGDIPDGNFSEIQANIFEEFKLVLVVRSDLKLKRGDIASFCCDATLACYKAISLKMPSFAQRWNVRGQAKVALKAPSEEKLVELETRAKKMNLCARSIRDPVRGRVVLGVGPGPISLVNQVTGELKLL